MGYSFSDMESRRIAELLDPFLNEPVSHALSGRQLDQISIYIDLLLRWNARINLTAVRKPEEIVTRHFGESLFAARHLFSGELRMEQLESRPSRAAHSNQPHRPASWTWAREPDSPGIPIKIWFPSTPVTLVEANHKKVVFLREVIRALTLTDVNVIPARAETSGTAHARRHPASRRTLRDHPPHRRQPAPARRDVGFADWPVPAKSGQVPAALPHLVRSAANPPFPRAVCSYAQREPESAE